MKAASILVSELLFLFLVIGSESLLSPKVSEKIPVKEGADVGKPLYLTPYILFNQTEKGRQLARVKPDIGNTTSYSGFLTVDMDCGNNLFFWFFPAQENWTEAPVVTWLQGGPGSSSMFGLFEEIGPFNSFPEGLQTREFSWNVKNNLLFFDNPVGAGFSFTEHSCYAQTETRIGKELYDAIVQFLTLFPTLQQNKFFVAGESYAGHYIPTIGKKILQENPTAKVKVNLQGLMIGDGWTDPREQLNYADYLYQIGLIDYEKLSKYKQIQETVKLDIDNKDWHAASYDWGLILSDFSDDTGLDVYNYQPTPADRSNYIKYVQSKEVRKAIHVGSLEYDDECQAAYHNLLEDTFISVKPSIEFILEQIPIVFYNGQVDIICGYPMQLNYLRTLEWSGQQKYLNSKRKQWIENGTVAGYIKGAGNMYDVLVRDAGHMVPQDQPFWAYQLVNYVTSGTFPPKQWGQRASRFSNVSVP